MPSAGTRPPRSWAPPERLHEYVFEREIGHGAMGLVYRYRDTLLDRPVAVKFIAQRRPDAEARQQFSVEARAIARLSHPNVVVVHRAGEVDGLPFLVTELVRGQTVFELEKPLPSERIVTIGLDVARGLAAAHRHGVLHRDVKPSNIVVDTDGEGTTKLIDFGLAVIARPAGEAPGIAGAEPKAEEDSGPRLAGTPVYMAPETLRGEPATPRSDVYSLGAVLYEMAAGVAPRDTLPKDADDDTWNLGIGAPLSGAHVDPALAAIVTRCLAPSPEDRYPSADAAADALAMLLPRPSGPAPEGNPYRGLASFELDHRAVFFGRAAESRAVVDRLRETSFAVVTGDSGVGKSSLCRAGVAPLVLDGALSDGRAYRFAAALPGRHPYTATLASLSSALGGETGRDLESAGDDPAAFSAAIQRALGKDKGLLLLVDQAEELVTLAPPEEARRVAVLLAALPARTVGLRLLFSVRGDHFTNLLGLPGLGQSIDHGLYVLRPLSPEGVRAAILGPASRHGVRFEPESLVESLAEAAVGTPGGLPLLQFALAKLWEARKGAPVITEALLTSVGGLEGALAEHAEAVIEGLSTAERTSARRLLCLLVSPEGTSCRRTESELALRSDGDRAALDALVRGRLIVARRAPRSADVPEDEEPVTAYEIAHEAMLSRWERLARWLDDSRDERRLVRDLREAMIVWERRHRRPEDTLSAEELAAARARRNKLEIALPEDVEAFLAAAEDRHAAARRRKRLQVAAIAAVSTVITLGSLAAANEWRHRKNEAEEQARALAQARGNLGDVTLVLRPFDWAEGAPRSVPVAELPDLAFTLHAARTEEAHRPGVRLPGELVRTEPRTGAVDELVAHVEAPGGMAFLRVSGRGRPGETCAPSWLRIRALPGYAERSAGPVRIEIRVPTCRATSADMVPVPAGPFIYGGPGDPPTKFADYVEPERVVDLEEYSIDRFEVSNAVYRPFGEMERLTGYPTPKFPPDGLLAGAKAPTRAVTMLDASAAEAFCRYMGKRLPGDLEWTKAARGGLTVDGKPNPRPKRLFPWGGALDERCVNMDGDADGAAAIADVSAYPCGASPHGVMNLAGNVAEWISREGQNDQDSPLRVIRGGAWDSPRDLEHTTTVFRNAREGRVFDFTIGVRCVAGGDVHGRESWDEH